MTFFGFSDQDKFTADEFHFFLNCLFRGVCSLAITNSNKMPNNRGCFVSDKDIDILVSSVFRKDSHELSRTLFQSTFFESKTISIIINYLESMFQEAILKHQARLANRRDGNQIVRTLINQLKRDVFEKIDQLESP